MGSKQRVAIVTLGVAAVVPFVGMASAFAATGDVMANLRPVALNGVNGSGTAMVSVRGDTMNVTMAASGLVKDQPHAAHIHFGADRSPRVPDRGRRRQGRRAPEHHRRRPRPTARSWSP